MYAFGDATDGKLGLGAGRNTGIIHTPQIVSALLSEKIIKVHAASRSPSSGSNAQAVSPKYLGSNINHQRRSLALYQVGAAGAHSVALSDRGTVFSWGTLDRNAPVYVKHAHAHTHTARTHARTHTARTHARMSLSNQIPGFGNGRLGNMRASGGLVEPAEVQIIGSDDSVKPFIVDLWCGRAVTLLLDTEGVLYSFGVSTRYCPPKQLTLLWVVALTIN